MKNEINELANSLEEEIDPNVMSEEELADPTPHAPQPPPRPLHARSLAQQAAGV